jgi:hypothetical protein
MKARWIFLSLVSLFVMAIFAHSAVAADKTVFIWHFDEGTGNTAADADGNHVGDLVGNAKWTKDGKLGGALKFDGSKGYVDIVSEEDLKINEAITMAAWVKPNVVRDEKMTVMTKLSYYLQVEKGLIATYFYGLKLEGYHFSTLPVPANEWTQIAVTYDGSAIKFYVNYEEDKDAEVPNSGTITQPDSRLRFGGEDHDSG